MTRLQPSELIEEFKSFIHSSCSDCPENAATYTSLHKGIVKMYFGARNVEIDYKNSTIKAEIPVSDHQYTTINFECQDLDRFLSSCLKKDKRSLNFYRSALSYYNYNNDLSQVA